MRQTFTTKLPIVCHVAPQHRSRNVTTDTVTSLHPMYGFLKKSQ